MIQYKDIQFYNDYCKGLEDFTLLEAFSITVFATSYFSIVCE